MSEEVKPVIDGAQLSDNCMQPGETKADESAKPPEDQKRWGMSTQQAQQFFNLCLMGLERMSKRQRTMFRRAFKDACRDLDARWPQGRPMADIEREIRDRQIAPEIIIPKGINPESLVEKP